MTKEEKAKALAEALELVTKVVSTPIEPDYEEDQCGDEDCEPTSTIYADRDSIGTHVFTSVNPHTGDDEVVYELEVPDLKWFETEDLKTVNALFQAFQLRVQAELIERSTND